MYKDFKVTESELIEGVVIMEPDFFEDNRGILYTDYLEEYTFEKFGLKFNHSKIACSKKNVLRGIHGDTESFKMVSCVYGSVFQVAVDLRPSSSTYLSCQTFELTSNNPKSILLPPGVGNAFLVTSLESVYSYKLSYPGAYIDANEQFTVLWSDPKLGIKWPITNPILSKRDQNANNL